MIPAILLRRFHIVGLIFSAALLCTTTTFYSTLNPSFAAPLREYASRPTASKDNVVIPALQETVEYFVDFPIVSPYKHAFGELGRRSRVLRSWIVAANSMSLTTPARLALNAAVEEVTASLFPFLVKDGTKMAGNHSEDAPLAPLADLRASFDPGSAGIVIPTGDKTARFAAHLIGSLRNVLGSTLPIQVAYAGDDDLSPAVRQHLAEVATVGEPVEFLDLSTVFNDGPKKPTPWFTLHDKSGAAELKREPLQAPFFRFQDSASGGGWAFKSFAALSSRFEKVILLDADAVFLQQPEVLLEQAAFQKTGALLFRDRLLWKNGFPERHQWWHKEVPRPSSALDDSLVWTERYAEEQDSGAVVLDKGRVDVLMGLLHTCWQNTYAVREEVTYRVLYGDKESWWMGLEMAGATYAMEKHYGGIVGWYNDAEEAVPAQEGGASGNKTTTQTPQSNVCSFVIAHVDENGRLLWYNGSLMKNKAQVKAAEYEVPQAWMVDGQWAKGARKEDMSCMRGRGAHNLTTEETAILQRSIELATRVDTVFA